MGKQNYCIDCRSEISQGSTRCASHAAKHCWKSKEYRHRVSEGIKAAHRRGNYGEEWRRKNSEGVKAAWERGNYADQPEALRVAWQDEERRCKQSEAIQAAWERGDIGNEEWRRVHSVAAKAAWARGDYDSEEYHYRRSMATKAAWERGDLGDEDWRNKRSEVVKAAHKRGVYDDVYTDEVRHKISESTKAAHARGCYEGVFRSLTSIELEITTALDELKVEHISQYRPEGYSRIYDEFVPPNILIEIQGDYWHGENFPRQQKRDAEKAQWAKGEGFVVIEIWEHEIKERGAQQIIAEKLVQSNC